MLGTPPDHPLTRLFVGVPRVGFSANRGEGLEWLQLTNRLALDGILFLPHQLRSSNTNIMMGLMLHHGLEKRGSVYLLVNSAGGSLQPALGLHDCIVTPEASGARVATVSSGLMHSRFMLHQAEGQQFGVTTGARNLPPEKCSVYNKPVQPYSPGSWDFRFGGPRWTSSSTFPPRMHSS